MLKNLLLSALLCLFAIPASALKPTPVAKFPTEAGLLAKSASDGDVAYAVDTDVYYQRVAGAWVPLLPQGSLGLSEIRFCGNGPDGATSTYMGPVLLDDTEADLAFGGAGCDALDNTTEATADAPWHAGYALKPVAMWCVGLCTGATAANDAIVFQLRDDAADVTGMTCTTAALGGDATPAQCVARDNTPATVAANSALSVKITMTNDDCNDAGDDFECIAYVLPY